MLSTLNKLFFIFIIFLFVGCSSRYTYTNKSYHASSYSNKQYTPTRVLTTHNTKRSNTTTENGNVSIKYNNTNIKNSKAMQKATMRPYIVFNKKYYPTLAYIGDSFDGIASWYGPNFHAKKTSNGEIYNMYAYTAAHKTLPMNTMVRVENIYNNKSVIVRINDRGPFVAGRIIDLSNKAAHEIDMVKKGTAKVRLTVVGFNGKVAQTYEEKQESKSIENYYVQVGVFSKKSGALTTKRKFEMILDEDKYTIILKDDIIDMQKITRVWVSGFRSEDEARDFKENNNLSTAMIIAQ